MRTKRNRNKDLLNRIAIAVTTSFPNASYLNGEERERDIYGFGSERRIEVLEDAAGNLEVRVALEPGQTGPLHRYKKFFPKSVEDFYHIKEVLLFAMEICGGQQPAKAEYHETDNLFA